MMSKAGYFTLDAYQEILKVALKNGYRFIQFEELSKSKDYQIILRHDIDYSPARALTMASIENQMGISTTYFVLLHADSYHFFDPKRIKIFRQILKLGHDIGLHFDYPYFKAYATQDIKQEIINELSILSQSLSTQPKVFSYHNPTQKLIEEQIEIEGCTNAYSSTYLKDIHYLSDSNQNLSPESIMDTIKSLEYPKIQLLIHPLEWNEKHMNVNQCIRFFIREKILEVFEFEDKLIAGLNKVYLK